MKQSNAARRKMVFEQDGLSDVTVETKFNDRNWGTVTRDYVHSANTLHDESKDYVFTEARRIAKGMMSRQEDQSATTEPEEPEERLGRRAMLVDII
jgi:hypothetical protein